MALFGAKFDDRVPDEKALWGRIERTNVMGQIDKLAKATGTDLQREYQWLCNTVHPSLGNMLGFSTTLNSPDQDSFPHRSGLKSKRCLHEWGSDGPEIPSLKERLASDS